MKGAATYAALGHVGGEIVGGHGGSAGEGEDGSDCDLHFDGVIGIVGLFLRSDRHEFNRIEEVGSSLGEMGERRWEGEW